MTHYLELDLDQIAPDPDLVRRVPYDLAMYYLALPLAQENGSVSVAMAHPENAAAVATLQNLLHCEIVPLRSRSETIRATIQRMHGLNGKPATRVLAWSATPECETAVRQTAGVFAAAQGESTALLHAGPVGMDAALAAARESHATLAVLNPPPGRSVTELIRRSTTPLVLVRGEYRPIERILVATRGYASDDQVLDWLAPFVRVQQAQVVLLPLLDSQMLELEELFCTDGPAKRHMDHLVHRLTGENVPTSLRMRPGNPVTQVVAELSRGAYDLLILAAEAHGQFVARVLDALEENEVHLDRPIFVFKPTDLPVNSGSNHNPAMAAQIPVAISARVTSARRKVSP